MGPDAKKRRNQKKKQRQKQKKAEAKNEHSEGADEAHDQEILGSDAGLYAKNEHATVESEAGEVSESTPESITEIDSVAVTEGPQAVKSVQSCAAKKAPKDVVYELSEPTATEGDFREIHAPAENRASSESNTEADIPPAQENAVDMILNDTTSEVDTKDIVSGSEPPEYSHGHASLESGSKPQATEVQGEPGLVGNIDVEQVLKVAVKTDYLAEPCQHLPSAVGAHENSGLLSSPSNVDKAEIQKSAGTEEGHVQGSEQLKGGLLSIDQIQTESSVLSSGAPDEHIGHPADLEQAVSASDPAISVEAQQNPQSNTTEETDEERTLPPINQSQSLDELGVKLDEQLPKASHPATASTTSSTSFLNPEEQQLTSINLPKSAEEEVKNGTDMHLASKRDDEGSKSPTSPQIELTEERQESNNDVKSLNHQSSLVLPDDSGTSCVQEEAAAADSQLPQEKSTAVQAEVQNFGENEDSLKDGTRMGSGMTSQHENDFFQNSGSDERLPWEQNDVDHSKPALSSKQENTSSQEIGAISQPDNPASALFVESGDPNSYEEQLPWESAEHTADAPVVPGNATGDEHSAHHGTSIGNMSTSRHEDLFSEKDASDESLPWEKEESQEPLPWKKDESEEPLPWEKEESQEPKDSSPVEQAVEAEEPVKKFSFLEQDE